MTEEETKFLVIQALLGEAQRLEDGAPLGALPWDPVDGEEIEVTITLVLKARACHAC